MARPEFKPTDELRHQVMLYHAVGMSNQAIAVALRIDEKTLTKHFARELLHGRTIIYQELLAMVTAQAIKGKKSAIALLDRMTRDDRLLERRRRADKLDDRTRATDLSPGGAIENAKLFSKDHLLMLQSTKDLLRDEFDAQGSWRREKASEHPSDSRNNDAADLLDRLAATVDGIATPVLQAYAELFDDLPDSEQHREMMRRVGFSYWPKDASEFVTDFIKDRTGGGLVI